jgi:Pro-kumamolisin, activation domain
MFTYKSLFLLLVSLVSIVCSTTLVRMEPGVRIFSSKRWIKSAEVLSPDSTVTAIFALKHCPVAAKRFEENLLDLSSPSSVNYGKWYTKQQVISHLAPSDDNVTIVTDFLASYGVTDLKLSEFKVHYLNYVGNAFFNFDILLILPPY